MQVEQPTLQPLATDAFPLFKSGTRTVHADGHVEVAGAFYPVPLALLGKRVRVQWDARLVRIFDGDTLASVHTVVSPGTYAQTSGHAASSSRQHAFVEQLLGKCERVGPALRTWADAALAARGVRAIRLIQGVLQLTRKHPRERLLAAAQIALTHHQFRYQTIRRLTEAPPTAPTPPLITDDPAIRPMQQYTLDHFLS